METYIVEYTDETLVGNHCAKMEIMASSREMAWEFVNSFYPDLAIDQIYPVDN